MSDTAAYQALPDVGRARVGGMGRMGKRKRRWGGKKVAETGTGREEGNGGRQREAGKERANNKRLGRQWHDGACQAKHMHGHLQERHGAATMAHDVMALCAGQQCGKGRGMGVREKTDRVGRATEGEAWKWGGCGRGTDKEGSGQR